MLAMAKPEVVQQGVTVIQPEDDGFLVLHPDGTIEYAASKRQAESKAKRWYRKHLGAEGLRVGVGQIEWR